MNVNEFIQFVRSLILVFINIDNSENELISHTSQSSSFSSTHILQKNVLRTQLQIKASSQSDQSQSLYFNYSYLIPRDLSLDFIQYMLIVEVFEDIELYESKLYKKTIVNDLFRD